jgi:branched-chain amino acid transport system ATP-binding protein
MSLAQHVYVLTEGRILTDGSPQGVVGDARVIEAYLGRGAAARLKAVGAAHG